MKYVSLCDGMGAVHAAWQPLNWQCLWTSEIEPFPAAVVEHHWNLPNLGDMRKITEADLERYETVDLLVGGTPCQSFSVAGLRGGLADPRGNLALRFLQLAGTMRPAWVLWENVPGVLSSNGGRDFGTFLGALGQLGYGFAYRILDAQYFGVPQRRRRVFVVGYLGDWRRAAAVLFERESLRRLPPPRREAGAEVAHTLARGACGNRGRHGSDVDKAACLRASRGDMPFVFQTRIGRNDRGQPDEICPTLQGAGGGETSDMRPCIVMGGDHEQSSDSDDGRLQMGFSPEDEARSRVSPMRKGGSRYCVRRLTPCECERLQGYPDGYTLIQYRGKPASDGPRYRALGNSMAVPVMRWIGERIADVNRLVE